jgi:hypothetical protein
MKDISNQQKLKKHVSSFPYRHSHCDDIITSCSGSSRASGVEAEHFPVFKAPRQCPLVLLVEEYLREGKALGSEKGKVLGSGHCYEQSREDEEGIYCV